MNAHTKARTTRPANRPRAFPQLLLSAAARMLPGGSIRNRYRQEFAAELYGMPAARQRVYAWRVMLSSWSLRAAVSNPQKARTTVLSLLRRKPLLCLLNVKHHWMPQWTSEGERYERCALCEKIRNDYSTGPKNSNWLAAGMM